MGSSEIRILEVLGTLQSELASFRNQTRLEIEELKHQLQQLEEQVLGLRRDVLQLHQELHAKEHKGDRAQEISVGR